MGSTYQRYKSILPHGTEWCVIEQSNYVEYGKENIDEVAFYYNLNECIKERNINVVLFSSSMQYLSDPYKTISQVRDIANYILIDETPFQKNDLNGGYIFSMFHRNFMEKKHIILFMYLIRKIFWKAWKN